MATRVSPDPGFLRMSGWITVASCYSPTGTPLRPRRARHVGSQSVITVTNTATTQALPSRLLNGLGEDAKPQPPPASDGRDRGQIASELCAQYLTICDYRVSQCVRLFRQEED